MRRRYSCVLCSCLTAVMMSALWGGCSDDDGDSNNNNVNQNQNQALCGNGAIDDGEQCDGVELGDATCGSETSFGEGTVACDASCMLVTTGCHSCGNSAVEGPEICDDGTNDGAYGGCATDCLSLAPYCGDGEMNGDESCDGSDFGGVTCDASGFPGGGVLTCDGCAVDASTCCQDGDEDGYGEHCDLGPDCDDAAPGIVGACGVDGCPQGFVLVAAGAFEMGCNASDACSDSGNTNERPRVTVTLDADYCVAVTEVSVGAFRSCVAGATCDASPTATVDDDWANWSAAAGTREGHPINAVTWWEARDFCQTWMNGDLPTEAQWEKAARGSTDIRSFPWGEIDPSLCAECNWDLSGPGQEFGCNQVQTDEGPATWEVGHVSGTGGDSPYGAKDMAGNVNEWVVDCYLANFYQQCNTGCTNPVNTCTDSSARVIRGGYFSSEADEVKVVRRYTQAPTNRDPSIGFRCVWLP